MNRLETNLAMLLNRHTALCRSITGESWRDGPVWKEIVCYEELINAQLELIDKQVTGEAVR